MGAGGLAVAVRVGQAPTAIAVLDRADLLVLELDVTVESVETTERPAAELAAELVKSANRFDCRALTLHCAEWRSECRRLS